MSPRRPLGPDSPPLQRLLDGEHATTRQRVREILSRPDFRYYTGTDTVEYRQRVFRWCQTLAAENLGAIALPKEYGGEADFAKFMAVFETIATHDISLTIKFTVQFGIWLGSVLLLGTEKHHRKYLADIGSFALPGCFAMTEIGHGSNVRDLETVARYKPASGEFVIHSPSFAAGKNYIGNGACHGRAATVFAQLETGGTWRGVHAFVVPIRDVAGQLLPGVRMEDNGLKMGENGVDNARLWFDHVRVPREALLDRFASVAEDGVYASPIASAGSRFFAMISALVGGRISIAAAGLSAGKSGLAIAVRYAARRRQFRTGPDATEESPLLDYPTHQRRLMPLLANSYALDFAHKHLVPLKVAADALVSHEDGKTAGNREVELLAAGLKAYITWNTTRTLQVCREACGGEGYISANRLPALKSDSDIFTTFEGDNTVLMLWIGRNLLASGFPSPSMVPTDTGNFPVDLQAEETNGNLSVCLRLLQTRERVSLDEIRSDLDRLKTAGVDAHAAMARQQLALLQAANAYVERVILECFAAQIATCATTDEHALLVPTLQTLAELFALSLIEQNRAWYLENAYITVQESKSLARRVEALCGAVAVGAVALVDAFGIPASVLAAPIASD